MTIDRRAFTRLVSAATAGIMLPRRASTQTGTLKDLVPKGWLIGVAINQNQSDGRDSAAVDLVTSQFNSITPENLLKFQSVQPQPGQFTFDAQDRYVAFGSDRGMTVIGHTLVWHSQTPAWVWAGPDGGLADRATMLERMRTHIAAGDVRHHANGLRHTPMFEDLKQSALVRGIRKR